ncbi:MAG TPA: hypothetical protein VJQ51_11675 [Burkholderiales bacterium]|nr:hypothetical protein [Burkholderiales bacterium]
MRFNPLLDVVVEVGYRGHAVRSVAHRRPSGMFSPSVAVRDLRHRHGGVFFEREFREEFPDADAAIDSALREGHRVVEARLDSLEEVVKSKLMEAV